MSKNPLHDDLGPAGARCRDCVWAYRGGRGRAVDRCHRHEGARIDLEWPACAGYHREIDCLSCGACCREAYHAVEVRPRDPFRKKHPDKVHKEFGVWNVNREGDRCAFLVGDNPYHCVVYEDRPRTCREFTLGSAHCADARQRVGLTR